jgi:dTDP-4-amino-4,6-dideoxygalactose transaminase
MNVPLLDLAPQLAQLREDILKNVLKVIDSTRYIMGPEVEAFEQEVADYSDAACGIGVSSGTDALLVALMGLDIGHGDLVLTTPYSFFATMGVVLRVGALPVFADIDPESYNIDPDQIVAILEKDTEKKIKAIIPVHLYGQCADMQRIMSISETYGVPVIEDAAQAIGAEMALENKGEISWQRAGSCGIAGCFSFFPSKNLGGIGDGGMVITQDDAFGAKLKKLRNHGAHPKYYHSLVGGNFRLDPIQATVLRVKLKHLEGWHRQRRVNADRYHQLFTEAGLAKDSPIVLPQAVYRDQAGEDEKINHHIYNQYIIRAEQRDGLRGWLAENNIGSEVYYPLGLHQQECLKNKVPFIPMPNTEKAANETIALPIYPGLTLEMQEYVVKSIRDFYR